ncbi:hypothetical protein WOLCODRAFT_28852 [Wolfiporia cocos MD-104 SS10]|uniref:CoA-dependent acyltransferase n=1 Tax=Wolfiporia cocos (strain MD-104) TaxID=742152 RepID=A0A2H3J4T9_WOLCO|nr:hypothetical protein WOLCODRAFT_28852 [Wolfiporia cocos MD-104 SS10]
MADASMTPERSLSLSDFTESVITSGRPLAGSELGQLFTRGMQGFSDRYVTLALDSPSTRPVFDDHVVLALAALRIRDPLLSCHVSFAGPVPAYVCAAPMTERHALKEARDMIEFSTFWARDQSEGALRKRWSEGVDPRDTLDIRQGIIRLVWMKGVGSAEGQYIFGLQEPHFVTDARRQIRVVRQFLELLVDVDRAHGDLMGYFSGPRRPLRIPDSLEDWLPEMQISDSQMEARDAYNKLIPASTLPRGGRIPDGTGAKDDAMPHEILRVWSREDTKRILSACSAHGVTITHTASAVMALAAMEMHANSESLSPISPNEPQGFCLSNAIDLMARADSEARELESEQSARIITFPVYIAAPPSAYAATHKMETLWSLAKQCRDNIRAFVQSPHFWQFVQLARATMTEDFFSRVASKPSVPYLSSIGDLDSELPMHYPFVSSSASSEEGGKAAAPALYIANMTMGVKADPFIDSLIIWTYDKKLHMDLMYSASRMTPALMDPYFSRIQDIISSLSLVEPKL